MLKLTEKQREAVFARDSDLLVSAAAGSGKTAVLSERILQAILDKNRPASVTDFLIVTFTNAAAAEMKDRIGKKIMEAAADTTLSAELRSHLRKQLSLLGKASITTIHSFCLDIIRNNFHFIDIDPAVRVADKNESEIIKLQVAEDMLEEMYSRNGALFSEICKWLGGGKDEILVDELLAVYRFLNGFSNPLGWLEEKIEQYNPAKFNKIEEVDWICKLKQTAAEEIEFLIYSAKKLSDDLGKAGITSYMETVAEDIAVLEKYAVLFRQETSLILKAEPAFGKLKPKPRDADADLCKAFKKRRDDIISAALEIAQNFAFSEEEFVEQLEKAYPRLKCIEESIAVFDRLFKEKKRKSAIIDFSDFEHLALEILSDSKNGVADSLRERYREIMIDEYQDCNQTQELIFSYINRKVDGKSSNMFMVGDIKQSIYRFRLADPDIFAEKNLNYAPQGLQRKIVLNKNFRSSATILDGINSVFETIMTSKMGGVDYSDEEKLYFREENHDKSSESKCELVMVDKNLSDGDAGDADYIAERILELVGSGYKFKDIAILARSLKSKLPELERALKLRNIPYFADGGSGYFESLEISILSSMLKVIDNPMQDIELVALLRSPVFEFDESLLARIRLIQKGPFYGALLKYAASDQADSEKCRSFLNRLSVWRDKVLFMPVDEFIEYLISDSAIDVFAASLSGGEQRTANLKLFVLQARLLQNSGFKGLFAFVSYMDRLSASGESAEAKLLSESSNVVRIITIHKSKGLEFPVVFLYGCETAFNKRDTYKNVILHKTAGIGLKFLDAERRIRYPLVSHCVVKHHISQDNLSEEMRVLYVALTRAKEKLICTATIKNAAKRLKKSKPDKDIVSYLASKASCYFDWIELGLDENWQTEIISPEDIKLTVYCQEAHEVLVSKQSEISEIKEIFEYKYPFEKATTLPSKLSVSEVKRRREDETAGETKLYMPAISETPSFISGEKVTAADKGIINHLVMRHIEIANPDVDVCVSNLINKGLLSDAEAQFIETEGIMNFFNSELGERLQRSCNVQRELSFGVQVDADELFDTLGYGEEKVMLQGIIDLIFEENGELVLVDYKTDRFLDAERKKMYKTQLELYAKAAEKIFDKKVKEKYLFMLKKNEIIKF